MSSSGVGLGPREPLQPTLDDRPEPALGDGNVFLAELKNVLTSAVASQKPRSEQELLVAAAAAFNVFTPTFTGYGLDDTLKDALPGYNGNVEASTGTPGKGDRTLASIAAFDVSDPSKTGGA